MSESREQARAALQHLGLPMPERERTLRVLVPKGTIPANGHRCLCAVPAVQAVRTAAENRCTTIRVEDPSGHKHEFGVSELLQELVKQKLGSLPQPQRIGGKVPQMLATRGHEAVGNTFEEAKQLHVVPVAVSGEASGEEV